MNRQLKNITYFCLLSLLFLSLSTQASVTATVDRTNIVIGETFTLKITIDENSNEQPDLTDLEQVFTVLGTSQASSTQIINGSYSVKKSWEVSLMPKSIGLHTIPPIKLGSQMTKAIRIKVMKSDPNAKANGDIFIEFSADKSQAYVKEQVILTIKLFYAMTLSEGSISPPNALHTIITSLDKNVNYTTTRNGKNYTVVEQHYALFAEQSGTLDLNPIIFNGRDNSSRRNFSMFSTGKPVRALSNALSLQIKPIPQAALGKPWIPAKNVQISQEWSKAPFKVGEPITRTITLFVEGLSETQIPDIKLGEIADVRVYPEQPQTQSETTSQTLKAYKQVKFAIIPMREGTLHIPEYSLQWFNTTTGKTEYAKLPPRTIDVQADDNASTKQPADTSQQPPKTSLSNTTIKNPINNDKVKIVTQESHLWKILSAIFALLWLATLVFYFKKKTAAPVKPKPQKRVIINKQSLIEAINKKDLQALETNLINWWNQQYPKHSVTNVSQIRQYVNHPMSQLIEVLELQRYNPQSPSRFNQDLWLKQINGEGLIMQHKSHKNKADKLADLYS